jgi:hypothetical protein
MTSLSDGPSPHDERMILAGEIGMLGELLPHVAVERLPYLRQMLRSRGRWSGATPRQLELVGGLLDACCRRMVDAKTGDADYFTGIGDMLPDAPCDARELEAQS